MWRTLLPAALVVTCAWGQTSVKSPDGNIEMNVTVSRGALAYDVSYRGKPVIQPSPLGLDLEGARVLGSAVRIAGTRTGVVDESYSMPLGRSNPVRNHCNTLAVDLDETAAPGRKFTLEARAYNDGVAFRYVIPAQPTISEVRLAGEKTTFTLAKDAMTYALILDGFETPYEDGYHVMPVSSWHSNFLIGMPMLAELPGTAWVAITEAHIDDYAGMYLQHKTGDSEIITGTLSPSLEDKGLAVRAPAPMNSPWRVLMIADNPGRLIESNIIVNLNPPSQIADTSWIKPGKTAWDWWSGPYDSGVNFKPGMNTATIEHFIDFASSAGLEYMLIDEGWSLKINTGLRHGGTDLTRVNPDLDMPAVLQHAKEKHVRIWLWAHWTDIERQMDEAFPLFEKWGIAGVKIDFMNRDDQWMVNYYHRVLRTAAEHHLMIDLHGAYKPDGIRRTWPNLITREGVMGAEHNKWSARVTGDHDVTLAFTRMLAGPMDYTPGGFNNVPRWQFEPRMLNPMVQVTRAHEAALYVVFESELQMLADSPEMYAGQKELDFIRAVPGTWDETRVVDGRPGQSVSVARRHGREWFLGSITGQHATTVDLPLEFLGHGEYIAEIYSDAPDAGTNAAHTVKEERRVNAQSVLHVVMAQDGGQAVHFRPVE